jgi:ethanolamine ammonia-lyase small subunit
MTDDNRRITISNPWTHLRRHTPARIALGRTGISIPTNNHLEFQLAHARARNAVHHKLDHDQVAGELRCRWGEVLMLKSAASDRPTYLQRPDLGRRLDDGSRQLLIERNQPPCDIVFIVADGLSAFAIEANAVAFLETLRPHVEREGWTCAPVCVVEQGRVAVGDEIGELLKAEIAVMLIGERPGLSSPDSLGLYLTYRPRVGATDADRNCISNVRSEGLSYEEAAYKLHYLISEARRRQLSGVQLKDEAEALPAPEGGKARNFLIDRD